MPFSPAELRILAQGDAVVDEELDPVHRQRSYVEAWRNRKRAEGTWKSYRRAYYQKTGY